MATGGSLALNNLTLSRGLALDSSRDGLAWGGAIRSQGTLSLKGVTVQNCVAQGQVQLFVRAVGGGIYSSGVLTAVDSTIRNNQAVGSSGNYQVVSSGKGGSAAGGGLYVAQGTASLTNTTLSANLARGGKGADGGKGRAFGGGSIAFGGGPGGDGLGGAIYAAAGTVELRTTTVTQNTAGGGVGGTAPNGIPKAADGVGRGGGIYINPAALGSLDPFTRANARGNIASTGDNDIFGSFSILA